MFPVSSLNLFSPVSLVLNLSLPLETILVTVYIDVSVTLRLCRVTHKCFKASQHLGSKGTLFFSPEFS